MRARIESLLKVRDTDNEAEAQKNLLRGIARGSFIAQPNKDLRGRPAIALTSDGKAPKGQAGKVIALPKGIATDKAAGPTVPHRADVAMGEAMRSGAIAALFGRLEDISVENYSIATEFQNQAGDYMVFPNRSQAIAAMQAAYLAGIIRKAETATVHESPGTSGYFGKARAYRDRTSGVNRQTAEALAKDVYYDLPTALDALAKVAHYNLTHYERPINAGTFADTVRRIAETVDAATPHAATFTGDTREGKYEARGIARATAEAVKDFARNFKPEEKPEEEKPEPSEGEESETEDAGTPEGDAEEEEGGEEGSGSGEEETEEEETPRDRLGDTEEGTNEESETEGEEESETEEETPSEDTETPTEGEEDEEEGEPEEEESEGTEGTPEGTEGEEGEGEEEEEDTEGSGSGEGEEEDDDAETEPSEDEEGTEEGTESEGIGTEEEGSEEEAEDEASSSTDFDPSSEFSGIEDFGTDENPITAEIAPNAEPLTGIEMRWRHYRFKSPFRLTDGKRGIDGPCYTDPIHAKYGRYNAENAERWRDVARADYKSLSAEVRGLTGKVKEALTLLQPQIMRKYVGGFRQGALNQRELHRLFTDPSPRVAMQKAATKRRKVAILLLLDESGSMETPNRITGERRDTAVRKITAALIEAVRDNPDISCSVISYQSDESNLLYGKGSTRPEDPSALMIYKGSGGNADARALQLAESYMAEQFPVHEYDYRLCFWLHDGMLCHFLPYGPGGEPDPNGMHEVYGGGGRMTKDDPKMLATLAITNGTAQRMLDAGIEIFGYGIYNPYTVEVGATILPEGRAKPVGDAAAAIAAIVNTLKRVSQQ